MVYDSARDRMLIIGQSTVGTSGPIEVWALTLGSTPTLTQLETQSSTSTPNQWQGATAVYDPVRDRVVLCGDSFYQGSYSPAIWVMELTLSGTPTWSDVSPDGAPPPVRRWHTAIYDQTRDRMIIFGGFVSGSPSYNGNDVWTLSLSGTPTWTQMTPTGSPPVGRSGHTAVYDGPRDRMVVFGGRDPSFISLKDAWSLSLSGSGTWSVINANEFGGTLEARSGHTAVVDAPRSRMLVFAGFDNDDNNLSNVWSLSFTSPIRWTLLAPTGSVSTPYDLFASVYDPVRDRMISSMGDEFWALGNLGGTPAWSQLTPTGQSPLRRSGAVTIYDAPRQRMLVFGGIVVPYNQRARDLWSFSLTDGSWTRIIPSGTPPPPRWSATAIYDPVGDRMILFGGDGDLDVQNDTWQLSLGGTPAWSQLTPSGNPPAARYAHSAIFDAPRNRMVVYGGVDNSGAGAMSDVWALSLAGGTSWSPLSPSGGPAPGREFHTAVLDAPRNRMLTFGWNDATVWSLGLDGSPAWSALATSGTPPPTMAAHQAAYDAVRDRMLVSLTDTYELTLSGTPTWGQVGPPAGEYFGGRESGSSIYDTGNDRWVIFGGGQFVRNDVIALAFPLAYPLNVAASPVAGGSVQQDPAGECLSPGELVTLTAVPAADYSFVGWSGDASGASNPLTVTMDAAKSITANFVGYPVSVTVSPAGSGTVTKSPDQATYAPGTQVTLTASGSFPFLGWSGDASGTANPVIVTVDGPKTISASFGAYTIATAVTPSGTGTISKSPNQTFYANGAVVTLTATPIAGCQFDAWSGDVAGPNNPVQVTVDGNKSVTANFTVAPPICGGWSLVQTATQPQGRDAAAAIWDPVRHRMLVSGGAMGYYVVNQDLWSLTLGGAPAWNILLDSPGAWIDRFGFYDPVRDRVLVFGGRDYGYGAGYDGVPFMETWATPLTGTPAWTQIVTAHTPSGRTQPSVIYDPLRDRLVLFGGGIQMGPGIYTRLNDVWQLNLSGTPDWTQVTTAGTSPPPRMGAGAIYDPVRDRMVIMAGNGTNPTGAWALSLAGTLSWSDLNPRGAPHATNEIRPVYDPVRDRVVVIWGDGTELVSTLAFKLDPNQPVWTKVYPARAAGARLGVRYRPAVVYDPDDDVVLVFGGRTSTDPVYVNTTVRLDLGPGNFLDAAAVNGSVMMSKWCYDAGEVATLIAAPDQGYRFNQWLGDASGTSNPLQTTMDGYRVIQAEFVPNVTAVEDPPLAFALDVHPNPSAGATTIAYSLPREARVRVSVFDIAGREVARLVDGTRPAGRHVANWSKASSTTRRAGIYLVRFETPDGNWTRRLALLR